MEWGEGEVVMAEERRRGGRRSVWSRHSQKEGRQVGERRGQCFCFFVFLFCFSFTLVVKGERTSSHCGGVALKVIPMAHAATLTHGCALAVPGGTVT